MITHCLKCHLPLDSKQRHYGHHLACFQKLFGVGGRAKFHSLARQSTASGDEAPSLAEEPHLTSYFSGHYRKYEAKIEGDSYLLKLSKDDYPELAPVEELCNRIADICGINVPKPYGLIDYEGELAFVLKNFIAEYPSHTSLQHIYHFLKRGPEHYNVEEINKAIFQETHSVEDVEMFFRTVLFDTLVGNHDRHGRNLAFVVTARRHRLAPIYDNPSAMGLESGSILKAQFAPKGKIWTRDSREPEMKEYLIELERLGMEHVIEKFYERLDKNILRQLIAESLSLSQEMRDAIIRLIISRYEVIHEHIKGK